MHLASNRIESIERNSFDGLNNLIYLNLRFNFIQTIEPFSFESNTKLNELDLSHNSLVTIDENMFNGLIQLKALNLMGNHLKEIKHNTFNNTNIKRVIVSIKNISIESFCVLKSELKPIKVKQAAFLIYYDPIYIENRVDGDCAKTYFLMKSKILYNFLYDYDMDNYLLDCKYNSQLEEVNIKYDCTNKTNFENFESNVKFSFKIIINLAVCLFVCFSCFEVLFFVSQVNLLYFLCLLCNKILFFF